MKIAAPCRSLSEIEMLIHFGADELYCGLSLPEWENRFDGYWWMNRRSPSSANIQTREELISAVDQAHAEGVPVYFTLNAPFYPDSHIGQVVDLCFRLVEDVHIDGLIVADTNLLLHLSDEKLPVRIHLSSLGGCFNAAGIPFYRDLGVKRIILPRQLTLPEIKKLVESAAESMEFEVFAVNDGCYYEEGFCQTTHSLGPFCHTRWEAMSLAPGNGTSVAADIDTAMNELHTYLWYQNNCGSSYQENGLPNGPCSLCRFGEFRDWGITAVKVVGREASFYRKMRSVQMVKAVMEKTDNGSSPAQISAFARSLRNAPEHCDSGYMCYFKGH